MALAVLMDAFVIRGTLVPAFMRLAGNANWWLPKWLKPIHAKIAISEHVRDRGRATVADRIRRTRRPRRASRVRTKKPVARRKPAVAKAKAKKPVATKANGRKPQRREAQARGEEEARAALMATKRRRRRARAAGKGSGSARRSSTRPRRCSCRRATRRGVDPRRRRGGRRDAAVDLHALRPQGRADLRGVRAASSRRSTRVMREAGQRRDDPVEAVKAMGRAYVRFGLTHPSSTGSCS